MRSLRNLARSGDTGLQSELEQRGALRACEARLQESRDALERARRKLAERAGEAAASGAGGRACCRDGSRANAERIDGRAGVQVEQAHLAHAGKTLQGLEQREEKRSPNAPSWSRPTPQLRSHLAQNCRKAVPSSPARKRCRPARTAREALDGQRRGCVDTLQLLERELSALRGRLLTLQKIQNQVEENSKIQDWIGRHELASKPRLWQKIRVEAAGKRGGIALRERLHAMEMSDPSCCSACSRTRLPRGSAPISEERIPN